MNKIDTQIYNTMSIISDYVRPTKLQRMPIRLNIASLDIRRDAVATKMLEKINNTNNPPVYDHINSAPAKGLKLRHPIWTAKILLIKRRIYGKNNWKEGNVDIYYD